MSDVDLADERHPPIAGSWERGRIEAVRRRLARDARRRELRRERALLPPDPVEVEIAAYAKRKRARRDPGPSSFPEEAA